MNAFDDLEKQLREAVRTSPDVQPEPRRSWTRRRGLAVGLAALVVGGGAAVAATGGLERGPAVRELGERPVTPNAGAGAPVNAGEVLDVRTPDPAGGPPWGLRAFTTTRGSACLQVGRVLDGQLGVVAAPDKQFPRGRFQPLRALPGQNSLCGGVIRDGLPVFRGLKRVEVVGGQSDKRRCSGTGAKAAGSCPITAVRLVRYGTLGPQAREARLIGEDGIEIARQTIRPETGGAYLFVIDQDVAPYREQQQREKKYFEVLYRERRRLERSGVPPSRSLGPALKAARAATDGPTVAALRGPSAEHVKARFANGTELLVAGRGRTKAALPGVSTRTGTPPRSTRAAITLTDPTVAATQDVVLTFAAPVALRQIDRQYRLRFTNWPRTCGRDSDYGGFHATGRNYARGDTVRMTLRPRGASTKRGRAWCSGTYTARVTYATPRNPRGLLVGQLQFTARGR